MSASAPLWDRLAGAGIVSGAMPLDETAGNPWYVTAMVGVAAWLAALFLLFFIGIALAAALRSAGSALIVGAVACGGAIALLRLQGAGLFLRQLAVATSLAGQGLVVYGILDHDIRSALAWLGVALFEFALVAAAPEVVHRALATLAATFALRMALVAGGLAWLFPPALVATLAAIYVASVRLPERDALWSPILAGLGLAVLLLVPAAMLDELFWYGARLAATSLSAPVAGAAMLALAWLGTVAALAQAADVPRQSRVMALIALAAIAVAVSAWPVPHVVVALALLLVAFGGGRPALTGLAVLALLGALAHAYYSLAWTLLAKSAALAATGAVLMIAGAVARTLMRGEDGRA
jgi:hypothetical protein